MNYLKREELARILAKDGTEAFVHIRPDEADPLVFKLFTSIPGMFTVFEAPTPPGYVDPDTLSDFENPHYVGRMLFDREGNWIYDGDQFIPGEQEQLIKYIILEDEGI